MQAVIVSHTQSAESDSNLVYMDDGIQYTVHQVASTEIDVTAADSICLQHGGYMPINIPNDLLNIISEQGYSLLWRKSCMLALYWLNGKQMI